MKKRCIQIVNCGSSSLKISLFSIQRNSLRRLIDAECKNMHDQPILEIKYELQHKIIPACIQTSSLNALFIQMMEEIGKCIPMDAIAIVGIGHRFIHGGKYTTPVVLTPACIHKLTTLKNLAPLHNPRALKLIRICSSYFRFPMHQIAVFDTAFHSTLPPYAALYAIPKTLTKKHGIKRYGFHGISHAYLAHRYFEITKKSKKNSKLITLHLGSGCSATAILNGKSIDTSMGFSPAEGLIMGTRAGDIDFALIEFLCKKERKSVHQITQLLNFESGLLGISGKTADLKKLEHNYANDLQCRLAIEMFCYRIIKYIGSFAAVLQGIDAIIFSGGIGENSALIRKIIGKNLYWLGAKVENGKNRAIVNPAPGSGHKFSTSFSKIELYMIATDENRFIAEQVQKSLKTIE